jgi:hypothetical protein
MSLAEWMRFSTRDMKGATLRSAQVQEIDRRLRKYHSYRWSAGLAFTKMKLLGELLDAVHYYLGHKAGSKRGDVVLELGQQVLAVARAKALEHHEAPGMMNDQLLWAQKEILV